AGFASSMGVMVGGSIHAILAAVGLAAVLKTHPALMDGVKILGGLYLIYLAVKSFQAAKSDGTDKPVAVMKKRSLFLQGIVVNLMNPKTVLFFVAFFPQFTDPERGPIMAQMFGLGLMFVSLGVVTDAVYGITAGSAAKWFKGHPNYVRVRSKIAGWSFLGLGTFAFLQGVRS
ncbi:MAG: LysE family translocator, partial [Sphingomonadales bacterium]|nr:LysE family translocator [Sphingomonadales bacterium]